MRISDLIKSLKATYDKFGNTEVLLAVHDNHQDTHSVVPISFTTIYKEHGFSDPDSDVVSTDDGNITKLYKTYKIANSNFDVDDIVTILDVDESTEKVSSQKSGDEDIKKESSADKVKNAIGKLHKEVTNDSSEYEDDQEEPQHDIQEEVQEEIEEEITEIPLEDNSHEDENDSHDEDKSDEDDDESNEDEYADKSDDEDDDEDESVDEDDKDESNEDESVDEDNSKDEPVRTRTRGRTRTRSAASPKVSTTRRTRTRSRR